jgi:hypothetical protein
MRHALTVNLEHIAGRRDAGSLDGHVVVVEVLEHGVDAEQRLLERDEQLDAQVVAVANHVRIGDGANVENEIGRGVVGMLVALLLENDLVAVGHALLDDQNELVLVTVLEFVTVALGALGGNDFALAAALGALGLNALDKAGSETTLLHDGTSALALGAIVNIVGIVTAGAAALLAEHGFLVLHAERATDIEVLERDRQVNMQRSQLLFLLTATTIATTTTTAAKELRENVKRIMTAAAGLIVFETVFAVLIVNASFVFIGKNFIGCWVVMTSLELLLVDAREIFSFSFFDFFFRFVFFPFTIGNIFKFLFRFRRIVFIRMPLNNASETSKITV